MKEQVESVPLTCLNNYSFVVMTAIKINANAFIFLKCTMPVFLNTSRRNLEFYSNKKCIRKYHKLGQISKSN